MGGSTQTFDWIFFAIVVPLPFLAALELLKTRFISERRDRVSEGAQKASGGRQPSSLKAEAKM